MVEFEGNSQDHQDIKDQEYGHNIFTKFMRQLGYINGKSYYTSVSGGLSMAFCDGSWMIQSEEKR